jgi:hypothetical protein
MIEWLLERQPWRDHAFSPSELCSGGRSYQLLTRLRFPNRGDVVPLIGCWLEMLNITRQTGEMPVATS